jgi:large subunit ribosomal protein L1
MPKNKRSKRYIQCQEKIPAESVPIADAVKVLKDFPAPSFDPTVELVMHLGIDPRQADQQMRGAISLPHGVGKTRKVIAFCEGGMVDEAKSAGAIEAGGEELVEKISGGWMDFDVAVAHPSMMKTVSKLGRTLGPAGKMPSPKAGTVTPEVVNAVKEFSAGKVEYRNDDGGNLHVPVGKGSFEDQQLVDNIAHFVDFVRKSRPSTTKGMYIRGAWLASTMSPSIPLNVMA